MQIRGTIFSSDRLMIQLELEAKVLTDLKNQVFRLRFQLRRDKAMQPTGSTHFGDSYYVNTSENHSHGMGDSARCHSVRFYRLCAEILGPR